MIYTPITIKALKLAYDKHHGQVDQTGVPYIFHPFHLAEQMDDEISTTVALLHDIVEDTEVTIDDLKEEFPTEVLEAVEILTKKPDDEYYDYINRIKNSNNTIALKVKLADLSHNMDNSRLVSTNISEEVTKYWDQKYSKAKAILLDK